MPQDLISPIMHLMRTRPNLGTTLCLSLFLLLSRGEAAIGSDSQVSFLSRITGLHVEFGLVNTSVLTTVQSRDAQGNFDGKFYLIPDYAGPAPRSSFGIMLESGIWIVPQILEFSLGAEWVTRAFSAGARRLETFPINTDPSVTDPNRKVDSLVYYFNTVQIPLLIGFHVLTDLVLHGGAGFEFLPFGITEEATRKDSTQELNRRSPLEANWSWANFFLQAGGRYSVPVTENISLTLGVHYRLGLINQMLIDDYRLRYVDILANAGFKIRF